MSPRTWVRLDNASNIFLAARTDVDTKVFRMSAEMDHDVDPRLLQQALDSTYERFPLYRAVLRAGVFWYYLQESDLHPRVEPETEPTVAPVYDPNHRTLLFRVLHHRRRITLELFHALSDGTGALWFLTDLVSTYVRLRHPDHLHPGSDARHELVPDSFASHFRRSRKQRAAQPESFADAARPAPFTVSEEAPIGGRVEAEVSSGPLSGGRVGAKRRVETPSRTNRPRRKVKVFRVRGTRTPDNRTRAVELTMPTGDALNLARAEGVSLTMYLTALFFLSVRRAAGDLGPRRRVAASVPVNLRQFFDSTSARNFFATVRVEHTFGEGDDTLSGIARSLDAQFRPKATPEALERKLRRFIRFERMPVLRVIPRPFKDVILGLANRVSNRSLTVAISNLGRVSFPEPADTHVGRVLFHVSAARPQFCAISHGDQLTVTFTSPFVETDHIREFVRELTSCGVEVAVAAAAVTESELVELGVES